MNSPPPAKNRAHGCDPRSGSLTVTSGNKCLQLHFRIPPAGFKAFETSPTHILADAAKTFNDAANALHLTVEGWDASEMTHNRADVERFRQASRAVLHELFPRGPEPFLEMLESESVEIVDVRWMTDLPIVFPWNLLWIEERGQWLGELAMFRTEWDHMLRTRHSLFDEPRQVSAGYAEDDGLACAKGDWSAGATTSPEHEYSAMLELVNDERFVDVLEQFTPGQLTPAERDIFSTWLARGRHLFHIAGHALPVSTARELEKVQLRRGAWIDADDIPDSVTPTGAFVLNICSSAVGCHSDSNTLAHRLRQRRVRAICATTNTISDRFGTEFAKAMYREMPKASFNLFDAVRSAQTGMLAACEHPMALFYVFEGDPGFVVGRS
jgi:hypothetical protein